ncbi:MAG: hypothetical protein WC796_04920 [Candidatus Pacearchaeota archaeon]|jgi:hypothetical protein
MKISHGARYAILGVLLVSLLAGIVFASDLKLLCLDKGQKVRFSQCNEAISDRTCNSITGCMFCVNEPYDGIYCPQNMNACNNAGLSCSSSNSNNIQPDDSQPPIDDETTNPDDETTTDDQTIILNPDDNTDNLEDNTDLNDQTINQDDQQNQIDQNSTNTLFGAGIGTRITVGSQSNKNKKTNTNSGQSGDNSDSTDSNSNSPTLTSSALAAKSTRNKLLGILTGTTILDVIVLAFLIRIKNKKETLLGADASI